MPPCNISLEAQIFSGDRRSTQPVRMGVEVGSKKKLVRKDERRNRPLIEDHRLIRGRPRGRRRVEIPAMAADRRRRRGRADPCDVDDAAWNGDNASGWSSDRKNPAAHGRLCHAVPAARHPHARRDACRRRFRRHDRTEARGPRVHPSASHAHLGERHRRRNGLQENRGHSNQPHKVVSRPDHVDIILPQAACP